MASDPNLADANDDVGMEQAGGPQTEQATPSRPRLNTFAHATDRHLDDLMAQRDRLEQSCLRLGSELEARNARLAELSAENARLIEVCGALRDTLKAQRLQRTLIGILGTILAAIGGAFVGVLKGWYQGAMAAVLFLGCLFLILNVILDHATSSIRASRPDHP